MDPAQDLNIAAVIVAATASIFLILVSVGFVLTRYHNRSIRQRMALQEQETAFQKELLDTAIQSQEKERKRIAKDMHDEVGAMLSTIKLHLGMQDYLGHSSEEHREVNVQLKSLVDDTLENVRRISHDLLPPTLEKYGFWKALEEHAGAIAQTGVLEVHLNGGPSERLPLKTELGLYRIAQELLQNTVKHAQAKSISISFEELPEGSRFAYRDDGRGLPAGRSESGLGMKNIQSRASNLGAELSIHSQPGQGMSATLDFPTSNKALHAA